MTGLFSDGDEPLRRQFLDFLAFGIAPDLMPEHEQSAEGLANCWPAYDDLLDPINRVLLPRADIATEGLVARLTDLGWEAEDVTAYRTVRAAPPPAPIREAIPLLVAGTVAAIFAVWYHSRRSLPVTRGMRAIRFLCISGEWIRDKAHLQAEILLSRACTTRSRLARPERDTSVMQRRY